ncbi:MAG TPA: glycosyl transferase [Thermodesulfobacteriota bacterium]|nr:glycosyl transferase [Thermodesulfobacteriota bacterium]
MADFYQTGTITTLHRVGKPKHERLMAELELYSMLRPIALVLPALYSDVMSDAMRGIVEELKGAKFINEVVVTLGPATDAEFNEVKEFMSVLPHDVKVVHTHGRRIQDIYRTLEENGVSAGPDGKGRSAWTAYGYVLATRKSNTIALHDCDIVNYDLDLLGRLCYPVVNPTLDFVFCKGYYARVTDKLHGRVTRLFVTPLVRALSKILNGHPFLEFLDCFRYPLAGEFCMITDVARMNRIPWDWGLEVGMLAEVYRNYSQKRICQVDIAENYEHKHQKLSADDKSTGLMRMSIDIAKSIFRTLSSEGIVLTEGFFKTLEATYLRLAEDTILKYESVAAINGLSFDRHDEAMTADAFTRAIENAAEIIMENPLGAPLIPNWNRVISAIPGILERLKAAVEEDNR